ncbi:hypothetical protein [Stappia indica]|uniref:AsmA-like C-terminal region n=1 Tax=Stappia indica TaxID=538381 RepID=A0A285TRK8_9HYPH|nr:hypothetical protein [Stappia indica]SOC25326.1 hypothetical protein SAMN05421512_11441 [Stappia indica]
MPRSLRHTPTAGALLVTLALASPATANPALDAADAFLQWAKDHGATIAEYGSVTETGTGDAIVRDAKFGWDLAFTVGGANIDLDIRINSPETRLIGVTKTDTGYHLDRYEQPGAHEFAFSGGVTEDGTRNAFDISVIQYDLVAEDYLQVPFVAQEDPQRPVSRFLPAIVAGLDTRLGSMSIRRMESTSKMPDGTSGTQSYEGMTITGLANGRIEEQRIEKTVSETTVKTEPGVTADTIAMREETGLQVVTGTDMKPLLRLFGALSADRLTGDEVIASASVEGMNFSFAEGSAAIGNLSMTGLRVDPNAPAVDIATIGDQAVLGTLPQDDASLAALGGQAADALGAASLDSFDLSALAVSSPVVNGAIGSIQAKDASYRGFGDFSMSDLSFKAEENNAAVDAKLFRMSELRLAPLSRYLDFFVASSNREPTLPEILSIVPTLGLLEMQDIKIASDELAAPVSIESYRLSMSDFINPIPTRIEAMTKNASFPVSLIEEDEARALFEELGLEVVSYSDESRISWNADTQTLNIDPLAFTIEGGGTMDLKMEIGGVPRVVFESPEQAQMVIATATVNKASLTVRDARLISAFIAQQAKPAGLSPETLALGLADQAVNELGPLKDTPFGQSLHGALKSFLVSPDELVITIEPETPVPAMQIMGVLATAPDTLPQLLNAAVTANSGR